MVINKTIRLTHARRIAGVVIASGVLLAGVGMVALRAARAYGPSVENLPHISTIDFYGLRTVTEQQVRVLKVRRSGPASDNGS
jgi:hypothetical protein